MAVDIDRVLLNQIPATFLRDQGEEVRDFWLYIMRVIWQLRNRTGGDDDIVASSQAQVEAEDSRKLPELRQLTKKVNALTDQIATIKAQQIEIKALKRRISELESASNTQTELRKLQRRIDSLEMQVN